MFLKKHVPSLALSPFSVRRINCTDYVWRFFMLITKPYQRERAVEYARRWALDRNPLFADFSGIGGNCTNFVSQCVLAGSCG